ncbi:MAG: hypothetical protein Q9226_009164, partial [Calogaya cf. arnoldii]
STVFACADHTGYHHGNYMKRTSVSPTDPTANQGDWAYDESYNWGNWQYGPAFNLTHPEGNYTRLPALHWDDEVAYLKGWHIKAEIHLVGHELAVLAILLDAGLGTHTYFFTQLPEMVSLEESSNALAP